MDLVRENLLVKKLQTNREWGQWSHDGMCPILTHVSKHQQAKGSFHMGLANERGDTGD